MPAATEQKPLLGKLRLTSNLRIVTGLHIGYRDWETAKWEEPKPRQRAVGGL